MSRSGIGNPEWSADFFSPDNVRIPFTRFPGMPLPASRRMIIEIKR